MKRMANGMSQSPGTEKTLYLVLLISNTCDIYEDQASDMLLVFQIHSLYLNVGSIIKWLIFLSYLEPQNALTVTVSSVCKQTLEDMTHETDSQ